MTAIAPRLVAIVNQNHTMLSLVRDVVEESGFRAVTLSRGEVGVEGLLEFVAEHRPDLVILDISWPFSERLEEYIQLRSDPRSAMAKWLILSTSQDVVGAVRGELGEPGLSKPFELDQLIEAVGALLEGG